MNSYVCVVLITCTLLLIECTTQHNLYNVRPSLKSYSKDGHELQVLLQFNFTELSLTLNRNEELSVSYKVYTDDPELGLIPARKAKACQYTGHVLGFPKSVVLLNACNGLRGRIEYGVHELRIEPLHEPAYKRDGRADYGVSEAEVNKATFSRIQQDHVLSKPLQHNGNWTFGNIDLGKCPDHKVSRVRRLTNDRMTNDDIMKTNVKKLERKYIEVSVVIDRAQYALLGRSRQRTTDWVEEVLNNISFKYKPYNVMVALVQLVIWDRRDLVPLGRRYQAILDETALYRQNTLLKNRWSDITILISAVEFLDKAVIGGAFTNKMCDTLRSTNINWDTSETRDAPYLATLIAHEIGHVLGLYHDAEENPLRGGDDTCRCPCDTDDYRDGYKPPDFCGTQDRCIMEATINRNYDYFSLCSRRLFEGGLGRHRCLSDSPRELAGNAPRCGNAVVEEGEACDCGSPEDCPILDPCCEVGTCQLKNTSSCYTGSCCDQTCQFKDKGTVCRHVSKELTCDFEEVCTGEDSYCPVDTYKQDGRGCRDPFKKDGYCSDSKCMTHLSQCREIFGSKAWVGDDECWDRNTAGNWLGNCNYVVMEENTVNGKTTETIDYKQCKEKDLRCGILQCMIHKNDIEEAKEAARLAGPSRARLVFGNYNPRDDEGYRYRCLIARYKPPSGDDEPAGDFIDLGQVRDLTSCGDNKFCHRSTCSTYHPPAVKCPSYPVEQGGVKTMLECSGHGACNNLNQCHCDTSWAGNDICTESSGGPFNYMIIIIVLCFLLIILPVVVFVLKHKVDMRRMSVEKANIMRNLRRLSRSASSIFPSTRSSVKMPVVNNGADQATASPGAPRRLSEFLGVSKTPTGPTVTTKSRDPKPVSRDPKPARPPPPPPPRRRSSVLEFFSGIRKTKTTKPETVQEVKLKVTKPKATVNPTAKPSPPKPNTNFKNLNKKRKSGQAGASNTVSTATGTALLKDAKGGLRAARLDNRTQSDSVKSRIQIPRNNLGEKPVSDSNIAKKSLQTPKLLVGKSNAGKKLMISGPASENELRGLDGRPKSSLFYSATDISRTSADSIDSRSAVSSTRALFEPVRSTTNSKNKTKWTKI